MNVNKHVRHATCKICNTRDAQQKEDLRSHSALRRKGKSLTLAQIRKGERQSMHYHAKVSITVHVAPSVFGGASPNR